VEVVLKTASSGERKTKDQNEAIRKICCQSEASFRFFGEMGSEVAKQIQPWSFGYFSIKRKVKINILSAASLRFFSGIIICSSDTDAALHFW